MATPHPIKAFPWTPFTTLLEASSSSSSSSSVTAAIIPNFSRLITTNAAVTKTHFSSFPPPIMVAATLNAIPQARAKKVRPEFKMLGNIKVDDDLWDRRDETRPNHCFLADYGKAGFIVSGNNQFEDEIPAEITSRIGKDCLHNTRRRSFWAEMKIALDEIASAREGIMVTWVISYFKLLLSLTIWKNMFKLINMLLLILLMPFNGSRRHCVLVAFDRVGKEEKQKSIVIVKKDKQAIPGKEKGPTAKMPMVNPLPHRLDLEVLVRRQMAIQRVREDKDDADKTARDFSLFVTPRGVTLFTQSWTPVSGKMKGFVLLLHGLNEHSGRYSSFAKQLNANGYKVYGLDWIGHGGSDGLHGYVHSLDDAVSDVKAFLDEVSAQNLGAPCFCFGHSTGGAILVKAALDPRFGAKINGLILTSPALGVQASHPIYTVLAPIMSILLPRYQCGAANKKGAVVSRDPEALVAKYSDPLVYTGSLRVRTGYEILRTSNYLQQNLRRLKVPFLVLHGTADVITNPKASEKLYAEASSTDKKIKLYEGLLHDLLFEPEREAIIRDIMEWLVERTQV